MIVIIGKNLPDAIRGKIKLWFIEVKPNVFLSGINDSLGDKIIDEMMNLCGAESGLMIIKSIKETPGYKIFEKGIGSNRSLITISGLELINEKIRNP